MPKLLNPKKVFNEFEEEWRKKTPGQKWQTLYSFCDKVAKNIVGIRVFSDMKVNWFSYSGGACSFLYFIFVFYTLWKSHDRGDLLIGMQCTCTTGMLIVVGPKSILLHFVKIILIVNFQILALYVELIGPGRFAVKNVVKYAGQYIYIDDERQSSEYRNLCEKLVEKLVWRMIIILCLIIISFCMMGFYPLYLIIFKHQRVTILNFEIPFMDNNSDFGFVVNCCVQTFFCYFSFFSSVCIEFGSCLSVNAIEAIPGVILLELKELEREFNVNGMSSAVRLRLRNVLVMCQDFNG